MGSSSFPNNWGPIRLLVPVIGLAALTVAGCSEGPSLPKINDLNPFAEKPQPLPGTRIPIMPAQEKVGGGDLAAPTKPITLPPPHANDGWTQPGGQPNNSPGHLALARAIKPVWTADAGTGSSSSGRLSAAPLVYDGRVYTLDAAARVTAFASGGSVVWRVSLTPEKEREAEGYGGGLALDNGRLYVATGFGSVSALDPKTGKKLWEKNLGLPVRASPTAADDKIYVVTTEAVLYALSGADGSELWTYRGLPEKTSIISNPSPAVDGGVVVVPYPSGDLVAVKASDGNVLWSESLARTRGVSSLSSLSDAARPAIDGGTVYAIGHAGRLIATQVRNGERLWSLSVPGTQVPVIAGDYLFVVDTSGQLLAITRREGKVVWSAKLPGSGTSWSGPTLAGGLMWLTSNKGLLVSVEPETGRVASQQDLGAPIFIAPVVAGGRMYVLTDKARLIALN